MLTPEKRWDFRLDLKTVVRFDRSEMMREEIREEIPKRRVSMSKSTGDKRLIRGWERKLREAERS